MEHILAESRVELSLKQRLVPSSELSQPNFLRSLSATMANLTLLVYVIGLESPFSVDIERAKTVDHLKKAILKETPNSNSWKDIDARRLDLYKVDIPDNDDLEQTAPQAAREKLGVQSRKLSKFFTTDPGEQVISILVEVPDISE